MANNSDGILCLYPKGERPIGKEFCGCQYTLRREA
jgi:hypothetical protein